MAPRTVRLAAFNGDAQVVTCTYDDVTFVVSSIDAVIAARDSKTVELRLTDTVTKDTTTDTFERGTKEQVTRVLAVDPDGLAKGAHVFVAQDRAFLSSPEAR